MARLPIRVARPAAASPTNSASQIISAHLWAGGDCYSPPSVPTSGALLHLVNARPSQKGSTLGTRAASCLLNALGLLKTYTSKKVFLIFLLEYLPVQCSQGEQGEALSRRGLGWDTELPRREAPLNTWEDFRKGPSES